MNYMTQFQNELANKLSLQEQPRAIVEWVCEKMLESYKNGLAAGRKRAAVTSGPVLRICPSQRIEGRRES